MNNRIARISCLSITLLSAIVFMTSREYRLEKPLMDVQYQPLLESNESAFVLATSSNLGVIETFNKPVPKSLEGIDLNIALPLDRNGNLIVGKEVKDLFELYLSAMGEEELYDILLRIQHSLALQLTSPALEQGYDALKRFIDYKVELANLEKQQPDNNLSELDRIRQQKDILAVIQQEYFSSEESDAFFQEETTYDNFMLEHLAIQQNENLTASEKERQIDALETSLPENVRAGRESAMAPAKVYEQARLMKTEGQSVEDIYQMRAQALGNEAATALAQLDQQREQWQQRLDRFNSEYKTIEGSGLSAEDQKTEVDALLTRNFNSTESIRVRALAGLL